jgi:hypothetical protein
MYTSFYQSKANSYKPSTRSKVSEPLSIGGLEVAVRPVLDLEAQVGRLTVVRILNERLFVVFDEELKEEFRLRCVQGEENIQKWIDLPAHANVATAFEQLRHDGKFFTLSEHPNGGNMYEFIEGLGLDLSTKVSSAYLEIIYDCVI